MRSKTWLGGRRYTGRMTKNSATLVMANHPPYFIVRTGKNTLYIARVGGIQHLGTSHWSATAARVEFIPFRCGMKTTPATATKVYHPQRQDEKINPRNNRRTNTTTKTWNLPATSVAIKFMQTWTAPATAGSTNSTKSSKAPATAERKRKLGAEEHPQRWDS